MQQSAGVCTGAAALSTGVCAAPGVVRRRMISRPNLLFIMTDKQFAGAMTCAGNNDLYTPAMDSQILINNGLDSIPTLCD